MCRWDKSVVWVRMREVGVSGGGGAGVTDYCTVRQVKVTTNKGTGIQLGGGVFNITG